MPKMITNPVSLRRDGYAHAVYGRVAWLWRWTRFKVQLAARVCARFRDWADVVDRLTRAEEEMPTMPKMPTGEGAGPIPYGEKGQWETLYPELVTYMVDPIWPNGSTRKPGMIFVMMQDGMWQVTLKEPNLGYVLRAGVTYPDEMFGALEALLRVERVPWMVDPFKKDTPAKKRK